MKILYALIGLLIGPSERINVCRQVHKHNFQYRIDYVVKVTIICIKYFPLHTFLVKTCKYTCLVNTRPELQKRSAVHVQSLAQGVGIVAFSNASALHDSQKQNRHRRQFCLRQIGRFIVN